MAESKVYVTCLLCNSRQNINYLCVPLGALCSAWRCLAWVITKQPRQGQALLESLVQLPRDLA